MKIDELITQAQAEVTAAEALSDTDAGKASRVATAKARLAALQSAKQAAQDDISGAVRTRIPDAETSAKEAERKALAQSLSVPVEKLDEEMSRLKQIRDDQQSEVDRERQAKEAAEQRVTELETSEQKAKRQAETARKQLEETLKRQAVERALLGQGVVHEIGEGEDSRSYLSGAYRLTDLSGVSVEVEVDDEGNLKVKGEVKGADEAAKKTKEDYTAMFGEAHQQVRTPRRTPGGGGGGGGGGDMGYSPNYNTPVQQQ